MVETTASAEQARQKLVQIAREIQRLADSPLPVPDFFRQFLRLMIAALGAKAGVVWLKGPDGRIAVTAEQGLAESGLADHLASNENQSLLQETFGTGQARCVVPETENGEAPASLIILAPLHRHEECVGLIELFQRANIPEQARQGYLQFTEQMSGYASRFLHNLERQKSAVAGDPFWKGLTDLSLQMQTSQIPQEVAMVAANDGRLLLKCDRVSIACRRGRKLRVEAVSGLEAVNHRSNLVRSMIRLCDKVLPLKKTFTFTGNVEELPAALKEPLADFIAESGSRTLTIVPLFEPDPLVKPSEQQDDSHDSRDTQTPYGCLIIEQLAEQAESSTRTELAERSAILAEHVSASLANARAFQRIFLRPLFVRIGRCREYLYGRKLLKTTAALTVLGAMIAALVFVKWEYRVEAQGKMMPVERHAVFAPWDGEIAEIYVQGGKPVKKGQPLLRIRNDELQTELITVRNTLAERREESRKLQAQIDDIDGLLKPEDRTQLQGQLAETRAAIAGLARREKLLAEREQLLTLKAPMSGVVATFRVEELLDRRPVQRGELLLEVMNDKGPWRLELDIEEHRMGHVLRAQQAAQSPELPLEFVLATTPENTYTGTLRSISTRPKRIQEQGSLVEVFATIADDQPLEYRIGAEVRAKIACGERRLGYVLFGDAIEFLRSRWWF